MRKDERNEGYFHLDHFILKLSSPKAHCFFVF